VSAIPQTILDTFLTRAWRYKLVAIDVPNIAVTLDKLGRKEGLRNVSPFGVIQRKILTGRCKTFCFTTQNFAHFQTKLPASADVIWIVETRYKHAEKRYTDIDCVMAATIAAELERNAAKITELVLITGDGDLSVLLDLAKTKGLPVRVVGISENSISPHLATHAAHVVTLF
jgi:uncharacterized LabA/DUF88 family protein